MRILALLIALHSAPAVAAETVWFHYGNRPPWEEALDFDRAVLSPRAKQEADLLESRGVPVTLWVQPFAPTWNGDPVRSWPYDEKLWGIVDEYGAVLTPAGERAELTVDDVNGAVLLPLHRPEAAARLAAVYQDLGREILADYGCDGDWLGPYLGLEDPAFWAGWNPGWARARGGRWCQCQRWQEPCSGLVLEKIGGSLNPLPRVWETAYTHPGQTLLLLSSSSTQLRRATAAVAWLTDAGFSWGFATSTPNRRAPEFFDLDLGESYPTAPAWERAPDVWQRMTTHGIVLLNMGDRDYRYSKWNVRPQDGLLIETRGSDGRWKTWRSTTP